MAVFKCKMCGGTIEFEKGATVGVCDSCGTRQTLPKLDDDQRANLYGRANHFRRNSDYDKAMGIYEQILNEDKTDAEAYWSIVLCRYGIEYVEDPKTHKRIPTVNRAQYTSIFADADYQSALQYADAMQKSIYEAEAKAIDDIQKGILAISQKEEPFDVFICYKETDEAGKRTPDSVLANDLYHQLTQEGFKVFFSRITLEDKLGSEYEPYIFAALNSAKVMVVLGTRPEYFNAVWVKNEWSRYLTLVKASDGKKMLIPAYKDMDPYDLPDAFSNLQAQDMSKLGFMQDLIRGIRKIVHADEPKPVKETVVMQSSTPTSANVTALMDRGFMALEDGEWDKADGFFEEALNQDAKNALCYLGKLMAELNVHKREDLKNATEPFDDRNNCKKASRFDAAIAKELADANAYIRERNETARKEKIYQQAVFKFIKNTEDCYVQAEELFSSIPDYKDADEKRKEAIYRRADLKCHKNNTTEADYLSAARLFASISDYKDAERRVQECREKAQKCREELEERRKENIYKDAAAALSAGKRVSQLESAIKKFESIADYKDAQEKADECRKKIDELRIKQEQEDAERKRRREEAEEAARIAEEKRKKFIKKVVIIGTPIAAVLIVFLIVLNSVIIPAGHYKKAVVARESDDWRIVASEFGKAGEYKDARKNALLIQTRVNGLVAAGIYHTVGLRTDGKVVATGSNYDGRCDVEDWTDIVAVSAGLTHTVGLRTDGKVVATGSNDEGQCDVDDWIDIIAVSAGCNYTVGLHADGKVVATGSNDEGQCDVDDWTDIIAIATGNEHTVGLRSDGKVVVTGDNFSGECDVEGWTDIVAVAAGNWHTFGLRSDGTVVATEYMGDNDHYHNHGECDVDKWKDIVAIAAGDAHTVGLRSDGTVIAICCTSKYDYYYGECDVSEWTDIVAISAGRSHTVGLRADGTVVATNYTGSQNFGQCNVNDWTDMNLPTVSLEL